MRSQELQEWLTAEEVGDDSYRHTLLTEDESNRDAGLSALADLVAEAHRDARQRFERLRGVSLDPVDPTAASGPEYPDALHTFVLQGYLGEIFAGLVAENWAPHGHDWEVPAFLFRGHLAAHQQIERIRQLGGPARPVPGRTGDDALAFVLDSDDAVVEWLWGEAKCTYDHDASMIATGHQQLSIEIRIPVDLLQVIEILEDSDRPDRERWIGALRELLYSSDPPPRLDLFVYVCGRRPRMNRTWIPTDSPHARYSRQGPLHAVEIHLVDFDTVLLVAYPAHVINRG